MSAPQLLSLSTVPIVSRVVAVLLAVIVAMILYVPSIYLDRGFDQVWGGFLLGLVASLVAFPFIFGYVVAIWGLPALASIYIVLRWLGGSFWATVFAGIIWGFLGLLFMQAGREPDLLSLIVSNPTHYLVRRLVIVGTVCGGVSAAAAWSFMWLTRYRGTS